MDGQTDTILQAPPGRRTNYRWQVCGLLLFATTVCYMDRQVFSVLAPDLQHRFGWSEKQYSYIGMAFQAAYAVGFLFAGRLLDRASLPRSRTVFASFAIECAGSTPRQLTPA